jgi:hypothetical protein
MTDRLTRTRADIAFLVEHWPHLVEERLPGTARPWRQTDLSPERRAQLDALARLERHDRAEDAPGESEAPVHVDVLDVLAQLTQAADGWASLAAAEAGADPLLPPLSAYADPRPYLALLAEYLHAVGWETADRVGRDLADLAADTATVLRLVRDGQRLDADCPWCAQPRALVIRVPDDDAETPAPRSGPLVVCESVRVCEPPDRDCGERWRGRPAWPWSEWDWLADRIRHAATLADVLPARRAARVYRIPGGCWLWQGAAADVPGPAQARSCGRWDCVRPDHIVRPARAAGE